MEDSPSPRGAYIPNGQFIGSKLMAAGVALVMLSLVLAASLAVLTRMNGYAVGYIWFVPAGLLWFGTHTAIRISNCRHRGIGFALGFFAGLLVLLGMYHIDQCSRWDTGWARLDRIPGFIVFRMETDGWWWPDGRMPMVWPLPQQADIEPWLPNPTEWNWHWLAFLGELVVIIAFPAGIGWQRASVPLHEELGVWMVRVRSYIAAGEEPGFLTALDNGQLRSWAHELKFKPAVQQSDSLIAIWFVADDSEQAVPGNYLFVSFGSGPLWMVPAEHAAAFADQSPKLLPLKDASEELTPSMSALPVAPPPPAGEVQSMSLPAESAANLNAFRHRFATGVMTALAGPHALQLILVFVALGMAVYLGGENPRGPDRLPWVALVAVLGIASTVVALFTCGWANVLRYKSARLQEAIQNREGVGFDPEDPRVMLVQMWIPVADDQVIAKPDWQYAFLLLDEASGEARLEGEFHRIAIPASAIMGFYSKLHLEPTVAGSPSCVLSVHTGSNLGPWQIDLQVESGLPGATYHEREEALRVRWQHLVDARPFADS